DPARLYERPVFARARRLCLALPETTEANPWNHPSFRAGKKTFCAFEVWQGRPSIAIKLTARAMARLLPRESFFKTPYGRGLWSSIWVDGPVDWGVVALVIERSYRGVANQRMLRALTLD